MTRAIELTSDLDRLIRLRSSLRSRLASSPLMDAPRFARNLEALYREAWIRLLREACMSALFEEAVAHHRAGRLVQAERAYLAVTTAEPDHAEASVFAQRTRDGAERR